VGGDALDAEIGAVIETLSDEQRVEPRFFPDNYVAWNDFFWRRYNVSSPPTTDLPLLPRATTPPAAAAVGARWAAPSKMCSLTSRVATTRPRDVVAGGAFHVAPTWELMDATADGILVVVRVGVEVGIPLVRVGIDAEDDGEEGVGVTTADQRAQQRRPHHPREGARLIVTGAWPQEEAEEGGRSGRSCV
jgi:hypothetical protein